MKLPQQSSHTRKVDIRNGKSSCTYQNLVLGPRTLTSESIKPNHPRTPQGEGTLITTIDTRKSKVTKIPLEVPAS